MVEQRRSLPGGHLTRGVVRPKSAFRSLAGGHPIDQLRYRASELARSTDSGVEGDRAPEVVAAHGLHEADLSGQGTRVRDRCAVDGHEAASLYPVQICSVIYRSEERRVGKACR